MSKFFTQVKVNTKQFRVTSKSLFKKLKVHPKFFYIFTLLLVCLVGVFYLISTNGTATKGYAIMDLEERLYNLKEDNKLLKFRVTELESLNRVKTVITIKEMKKVSQMDYVTETGQIVAVNE